MAEENLTEAAKANGGENPSANKEHNVKARKDAITDACKKLFNEDRAIDSAIATHVQAHRDEKSKIKRDLREGYGITAKAFNKHYALWKLEQEAIASKDDATLDHIRELQECAPIGGMTDMVKALKDVEAKEAAVAA